MYHLDILDKALNHLRNSIHYHILYNNLLINDYHYDVLYSQLDIDHMMFALVWFGNIPVDNVGMLVVVS